MCDLPGILGAGPSLAKMHNDVTTLYLEQSHYVTEELPVVTVFITRERENVIRICLNHLFDGFGWIRNQRRGK